MRVAIRKWGNSLALRIPKVVAEDSKIRQGSLVEVEVRKGRLVVTPIAERTFRLDQLLRGVTKKNLHREIGTEGPVGREQW